MQRINPFIQEFFRLNGVGSLQDIHVMLRHHSPVFVGQIQGQWLHIEIKKELNPQMRQEEYLVLSGGSNTVCRTNAHYKYDHMEELLNWARGHFSSFLEYDRMFQELGYELVYPMKYVRHGSSYTVSASLYTGRWQVYVTERVFRFLEGKDLLSEMVEIEKEFLTLEEIPLLNSRLRELVVKQ